MEELVKSKKSEKTSSMIDNFWKTDVFDNTDEPEHAVNIRDTEAKFKLEVAAPGFKKGDFKITTDNGILTITAESSKEEHKNEENYSRKEFSRSSFTGSFHLPQDVAQDHISATYRKGLLCIDLKKVGLIEPQKREIKVHK
ncbi:Hsp20/alpha crystallin family protein [Pedobacter sp. NJ-S-72]